jgi:hypothetical protein
MDLLTTARKLEAALTKTLDRAVERVRESGPREPLEIVHAVVDAVATHVQPGGRGRYVFPFNRIKVTFAAPTKDARARLEAVIDAVPSLRDRIGERLTSAGCDGNDVEIRSVFVPQAPVDWPDRDFHLDVQRVAERAREIESTEPPPRALELTIEHGTAAQAQFTFCAARVNLGRCAEVRDQRHRLIRTNQVAFADDGDAVNASVSRQHAHIACDATTGDHRLCDDRSAHGTGILRGGRLITVPPGSRGLRLESGDAIVLGEARIRVALVDAGPALKP